MGGGNREIENGLSPSSLIFLSSPSRAREDLLGPCGQNLCFYKSFWPLTRGGLGKYMIEARWRKKENGKGGSGLGGYHPTS